MKKNLVVLSITIMLLVVLMELTLQFISPPILFPERDFIGPESNIFGWIPFPNKKYAYVDPDTLKLSYFTTNSEGWKDVEHQINKPGHVIRILFIGDSVTWGFVHLNDLYTREVERLLKDRGYPDVEVISMGVYAWGTDHELEALEKRGLQYSPDIVVYQFTPNDVINNILPNEATQPGSLAARKKFRYEIINGSLKKIRLSPATKWTPTTKIKMRTTLLKSALIYNLNIVRHKIVSRSPKNPYARASLYYDPLSDYFMFRPDKESKKIREAWKLLEALVIKMKRVSEQHGADLVIFGIAGESIKRLWDIRTKRFQTDGTSDFIMVEGQRHPFEFTRPLTSLSEICERNKIPLIKPIRQYERYTNDPHPNATGNQRMAQDIVEFLLSWKPFTRRLSAVR